MRKLIIYTSVIACCAVIRNGWGSVPDYHCQTGTCAEDISYSGASCTCDGYTMASDPQYSCQSALDCAYNEDDIENSGVVCYQGWCARTIATWCEDYQYTGSPYGADGLFDDACYDCPANATCDGYSMECNAGYYMVHMGQGQQIIYDSSDALVLGCQKCPAGTSGQKITSNPGATNILDCYATGGTDSTGAYTYVSGCFYDE